MLEQAGVAFLPGSCFGRGEDEWSVRLALVDFDGAKAMAALETRPADEPVSAAFLETHCGAVLDGVRRLTAWLEGRPVPVARARESVPEPAS